MKKDITIVGRKQDIIAERGINELSDIITQFSTDLNYMRDSIIQIQY